MHKLIIIFLLILQTINAKEIHPTFTLKSIGYVNDFVVVKDKLYAANDAGTVDIFDLKTKKIVNQIILNPTLTGRENLISPNIISVDHLNGKTLIVSIGKKAYRNVWIYENHKLKQIMNESKKLTIKEAKFIDDEKIMLGTFGSDIILHDTTEKYNLYNSHISQSTLGDITLSHDKKKMIMSDESGEVKIVDVQSSQVDSRHSSQNVDNIYHVAYANGVVITAGQDRRVGVYQDGEKDYHIKSNFMVYCVGITPSGKTGIYSSGEQGDLQLFDTKTKQKGDVLVGHDGVINQIHFINEKELFSSQRANTIFFWRLH